MHMYGRFSIVPMGPMSHIIERSPKGIGTTPTARQTRNPNMYEYIYMYICIHVCVQARTGKLKSTVKCQCSKRKETKVNKRKETNGTSSKRRRGMRSNTEMKQTNYKATNKTEATLKKKNNGCTNSFQNMHGSKARKSNTVHNKAQAAGKTQLQRQPRNSKNNIGRELRVYREKMKGLPKVFTLRCAQSEPLWVGHQKDAHTREANQSKSTLKTLSGHVQTENN